METKESPLLVSIRKSRDRNELFQMLKDLTEERQEHLDEIQAEEIGGNAILADTSRGLLAIVDQEIAELKEFGRKELGMELP